MAESPFVASLGPVGPRGPLPAYHDPAGCVRRGARLLLLKKSEGRKSPSMAWTLLASEFKNK